RRPRSILERRQGAPLARIDRPPVRSLDLSPQVQRLQVAPDRALGNPQRLDQLVKRRKPLTRDQGQQDPTARLGQHAHPSTTDFPHDSSLNIQSPSESVKSLQKKSIDFERF